MNKAMEDLQEAIKEVREIKLKKRTEMESVAYFAGLYFTGRMDLERFVLTLDMFTVTTKKVKP